MKWLSDLPGWVRSKIPNWAKQSQFYEVTKTACGEIAVLVFVFPFLDWFLGVSNPAERAKDMTLVAWSPLLALVFFVAAILAAGMEKKLDHLEKGDIDWPSHSSF